VGGFAIGNRHFLDPGLGRPTFSRCVAVKKKNLLFRRLERHLDRK
jgi:hypothetical protein